MRAENIQFIIEIKCKAWFMHHQIKLESTNTCLSFFNNFKQGSTNYDKLLKYTLNLNVPLFTNRQIILNVLLKYPFKSN